MVLIFHQQKSTNTSPNTKGVCMHHLLTDISEKDMNVGQCGVSLVQGGLSNHPMELLPQKLNTITIPVLSGSAMLLTLSITCCVLKDPSWYNETAHESFSSVLLLLLLLSLV
eukprot:m.242482 g.242482  ORF g.242482 m.242482 type:complete len:112 (-) comp34102_c0_seq1:671-1006(-)